MLYRLLRPDENWQLGLLAKHPTSQVSVFDHVIHGSNWKYQSKYISTCGSLNAMLEFRSNLCKPYAQIVQISEDYSPVLYKIDLRLPEIRSGQYTLLGQPQYPIELINKFNNFAMKFEEVLLVGHVPASHIQLVDIASFVPVSLPT